MSVKPPSAASRRQTPLSTILPTFTSEWFLLPQGTGILAVILHQLPYQFPGLGIISIVFWLLTLTLLLLFGGLYLWRALRYPVPLARTLRSEVTETACLASVAITMTTILDMVALVLVPSWGPVWGQVALWLWWVNTGMSLLACLGIPYVLFRYEHPGVDGATPAILLPLISALTSAAGGGIVCRYAAVSVRQQVPVIVTSYLLLGLALPLSIAYDAVFLARLFDGKFPRRKHVWQLFILCGPLGQGGFALLILGQVIAQKGGAVFGAYHRGVLLTAQAGTAAGFASMLAGVATWGYGSFWWGFGCVAVLHDIRLLWGMRGRGLVPKDERLAAWGAVFPWGVYTNCCVQLAVLMDSVVFKVWSTVLTVLLVLLWAANMIATARGVLNGRVFGLDGGWRAARGRGADEVDGS